MQRFNNVVLAEKSMYMYPAIRGSYTASLPSRGIRNQPCTPLYFWKESAASVSCLQSPHTSKILPILVKRRTVLQEDLVVISSTMVLVIFY